MQVQEGVSIYFSREVGCPILREKWDMERLVFDKKKEYLNICCGGQRSIVAWLISVTGPFEVGNYRSGLVYTVNEIFLYQHLEQHLGCKHKEEIQSDPSRTEVFACGCNEIIGARQLRMLEKEELRLYLRRIKREAKK